MTEIEPKPDQLVTVSMPPLLIDHIKRQADYQCCSRAAYLRGLVVRDMAKPIA